jgi:hypothetical protein
VYCAKVVEEEHVTGLEKRRAEAGVGLLIEGG